MPNNTIVLIERLPVELIHRIFDNLDVETIFFSIRPVSRLFRSIVHTYDRYTLDFQSISKQIFLFLCRFIHPQNVISLILSNEKITSDQIALFISFNRLQKYTRLRSLTLLHIDESQLQVILRRIHLPILTSFSFSIREYHDGSMKTTTDLLTSLISRSKLRKMEFHINNERLSNISWPVNCTIQQLTMNGKIPINDLLIILQGSPHLYKLVLSEFPTGIIDNSSSRWFPQILSLTIREVRITIDELELFLLMTPSLIYLKLIGGKMMMNGKRWKEFIIRNLSQLSQFEFYFSKWELINQTQKDLQLILSSFQTPFWIEYKNWFVTCQYNLSSTGVIHLYSIPICKPYFIYEKGLHIISLSTCLRSTNRNLWIMDNITSLDLILNKSLADDIHDKGRYLNGTTTTDYPLFPQVTEMNLEFHEEWPLYSLQTLSIFIDISRLVRLTMHSNYFNDYNKNIWKDIGIFIKQAHNLLYLSIQSHFDTYYLHQTMTNISSILPRHLKHLKISIHNLKQITMILKRCKNLSTITFATYETKLYQEVIEWFTKNTINSTCQEGHGMVSVWLGKRQIPSTKKELHN